MSISSRIPLPDIQKDYFKDVFDYLETIRARKQKQSLLDAQARHANAQASREEKLANLPFAGRQLPGAAGRSLALEMIKEKYGENSQEYQEAKSLHDLERRRTEQTINYQQSLMNTQGKRFATPIGKLAQEQDEIEHGIMPGTSVGDRQGKLLTPEQQEKLKGQYSLKQLKDTTDSSVRERILYAKNMDKTLNNLNVDHLTSYSGLKGAGELLNDTIQAQSGNISPRYQNYKEALTAAETLAKQVRQFYGDSITAGVQAGLKKLTDPTSWLEHPKVAKARFNAFKKILQTEAKTFTDATQSAKIFEEEPASSMQTENTVPQKMVRVRDNETGKIIEMTQAEAEELMGLK